MEASSEESGDSTRPTTAAAAAAVAAGGPSSVSSKLDAATKPQLVSLLTKQMARMKEADRRAAELSAQLAALQREREIDKQAAQQRETEWRTQQTEARLASESAAALQHPQATAALQRQVEQLHAQLTLQAQQQQQADEARESQKQMEAQVRRPINGAAPTASADGGADAATSGEAAPNAPPPPIDDEQHLRLSVDVVELRHAAVVRSYEDRLSALNSTLVKYKGVTVKLHDKLKAMAEQLKALNLDQARAAAQQARADRALHDRAAEWSVLLDMVEVVMGSKERAQWEVDMRRQEAEEEEVARAAAQRGSDSNSEDEQQQQQQQADSGAAARTSPQPAPVNGAGSGVSSDGSLSRLSRLMAAVQRQSGEVRRMKEESLAQLLALSQAQQTSQHNSQLSHSLNHQTQQLADMQQRVSQLELSLSSCQSDLSVRDSKLTKLRSLLSRLTRSSDEQKSDMAALSSEREALLRCIQQYRYLVSLPWPTVAGCTSTSRATLTTALSTSTPSPSPPSAVWPFPVAAVVSSASSLKDESIGSDSTAQSSSPTASFAGSLLPPLPSSLDEPVDVDECQAVMRVTLNDATHWLLLSSTRRENRVEAAATILIQRQQRRYQEQDGDGEEGEARDKTAAHSFTDVVQPPASAPWHTAANPSAPSDRDLTQHALPFPPSSAASLAATGGDEFAANDAPSARSLFWSELTVYLAYKWSKYQAATKQSPDYVPFAVLQRPSSSSDSSPAGLLVSTPGPSSPLSSFVALLSSTAALHCSLLLFDGGIVPADCLSLVSSTLSSLHSSAVSRLRAVHHATVSGLTSAARDSELSHEAVVREFSRYQQRTRSLLAQKQVQLDELMSRDEEAEGLRSSLAALSAQLEAVNRDKSSQAASVVALAQQLQACQADKERALLSERATHSALSALQADLLHMKEAAEVRLASEQQRAEQAEEVAQRVARQLDDMSRRTTAAVVAAPAIAAAQQVATERNSASLPAAASLLTPRRQQSQPGHSRSDDISHMTAAQKTSQAADEQTAGDDNEAGDGSFMAAQQSVRSLPHHSPRLTVAVLDSPSSAFLASSDGWDVDDAASAHSLSGATVTAASMSGELSSLRARVRSLQSLIQQREISLVQLQSALDASTGRCRSLESDLNLLRSMEPGSSNVEYLRNVLCRFLQTDDDSLIPVLCTLLNVDKQQQSSIVAERAKHPHTHSQAASHSHGRARQSSAASAPAAQPPSFFSFF